MPRAKKTWGEKMKAKPPHHVILEKDFAGIAKGAKMLISCPAPFWGGCRIQFTCGEITEF